MRRPPSRSRSSRRRRPPSPDLLPPIRIPCADPEKLFDTPRPDLGARRVVRCLRIGDIEEGPIALGGRGSADGEQAGCGISRSLALTNETRNTTKESTVILPT